MPFSYNFAILPCKNIIEEYTIFNKSLSFLSTKYKLNRNTIKKILQNENIDIRDRFCSHNIVVSRNPNLILDVNEITRLYNEGNSLTDLSDLFNCSIGTMFRFFKKNNIKVRMKNESVRLAKKKRPCTEETKKKIISSRIKNNIEKYGVQHNSQIHISKEMLLLIDNPEWLKYQHHILKKTKRQIAFDLGISPSAIDSRFIEYKIDIKYWTDSSEEKEVYDFIKSLNFSCNRQDKEITYPLHLDITILNKNLAIEYDGIYWHSYNKIETLKEKHKHLNKTELCEKKNIQLLHIFSNEWTEKQDIVKSIIKTKLGIYDNVIYARKCIIKNIEYDEFKFFVDQNHIQGFINSKVNLGLFYENELVSVMTFSTPRFNKNYEWEMIRFCNKLNTRVVGGASKLLSYFKKQYSSKSIISYADRRYFNGRLYEKLGFKFLRKTKPNYFYTYGNSLESRIKFQKHKLKNLLSNFDPNLTESQNMFNNGYRRIWDCGNLVYVLE